MKNTWIFVLLLLPTTVFSAEGSLYLSPAYGIYEVDDIFDVRILADSDGASINAAEAEIEFNPEELQVESLSTEGSILSSWSTEPDFSNEIGVIRFAGWASEHYRGKEGLLATVSFRALKSVRSNARFAAGALLAADSIATNIVTGMRSGVYAVSDHTQQIPQEDLDGVREVPHREEIFDEPLFVPLLLEYPRTLTVGERLVLKGTALSDVLVRVWLGSDDIQEPVASVRSSSDGTFTFVSAPLEETGLYRVWVDARRGEETSDRSDYIVVSVTSKGASETVALFTELLYTVLPYAALIFLTSIIAGYFLHRRALEKMRHSQQVH